MRAIRETRVFKRDLKRTRTNPRYRNVDRLLAIALRSLVADIPLPEQCKDHPLSGEWRGSRDCHLGFDLVLIYRKTTEEVGLVRLGTHSELFRK
jgi:mRNA interferase YafQ